MKHKRGGSKWIKLDSYADASAFFILECIFFIFFPALAFNLSPCRCYTGTCKFPFHSTQQQNCTFIIASTPEHIRLVRRESSNQKHLWSSEVAAASCPTFSVAAGELVVRWGDSESWWYKIQQIHSVASRFTSFCLDFRYVSCSGATTFNLHPHLNLQTRLPVQLLSFPPVVLLCGVQSNLRPRSWQKIQRQSAFTSKTLSPHGQHLLDILLLCLIPDAQKKVQPLLLNSTCHPWWSRLCNNRLISSVASSCFCRKDFFFWSKCVFVFFEFFQLGAWGGGCRRGCRKNDGKKKCIAGLVARRLCVHD